MGIYTTVLIILLIFGFCSVKCQTGTEILVCDFEMPMDCGFVVRTAAGGIQWSLNNGGSYDGRVYGPPKDHTKKTADGYYASTVVVDNPQVTLVYPVQTDMMSPTLQLPSGEGSLVFYFYVWRSNRNDQRGTTLNVYGCQGRKLWGTTVHATMQGWSRLEIPLQCFDPFEIYFEGIHETVDSSISIDDVMISSAADPGNHSPLPPHNPGIAATGKVTSIPASTAAGSSGTAILTRTIEDVVTPTKVSVGNTGRDNNGSGTFLAVILFLLAFLLLSVSVAVHMYFWKRRWSRTDSHRQKSTGIQLQNSAYDCLTLQHGALNDLRGSPEGHSLRSSTKSLKDLRTCKSHVIDMDGSMSTGAATMDRKRSAFRSGKLHRTRSKTLPSKNSTLTESSSFKYYEIVEVDDTTGKNVFRRAPKLSVIGKRGAISRSNSVPCQSQSSNGYEKVEWIGPGGLYHITDLMQSPLRSAKSALRRTVFSFDADSLSSFESSRSNLGQWSNYTTPFGTIQRRSGVRDSGSSTCPSAGPCTHRYSTPSPRQSRKFKNDEVFIDDTNTSPKQGNVYDTPQARRKAYRKQSTDQRGVKSPNYYTLEPTSFIPDIVASNKLVSSSSESSRDSERIECLDSGGSCNTLNDVLTDHEGERKSCVEQ